jgi:hypothetical protein
VTETSTVQSDTEQPVIGHHGEPIAYNTLAEWEPERGHYIEETVQVYLRLSADGTRWIVDGASIDGYGLDSVLDQPRNSECPCDQRQDCATARHRAESVDLPDGEGLMRMLAESLGYELTKKQA